MGQTRTGSRRQQQKAETRALVLQAAYALFEENGYEQTTMRSVAERAGVALGTIFVHFPDKKALLNAAFEVDIGRVTAERFASLPPGDLRAQLLHLARGYYQFYAARPVLARALVRHALIMTGPGGERIQAQLRDFIGLLSALFQAAIDRGELRGDLVAEEGALGFWADYFFYPCK